MLDPSSSEEEEENEILEDENNSDVLSLPSADQKSLSASGDNLSVSGSHVSHSHPRQHPHREGHGGYGPGHGEHRDYRDYPRGSHGHGGYRDRPASPSPSLTSERERERQLEADLERIEREEEERKKRLQLYVFVLRCIAYPFNAKQPTDMARRQTKVSKQQLQTIKERFAAFLNGETNIVADEAFTNAVQSYYEVFLKSDRVANMVRSGGCSANDFREVFKNNIEKRVRSLPEIDGLSKETVLSSWMTKFDQIFRGEEDPRKQSQRMSTAASELILSKEQLYEMFQNILNVKKYEHQILYNACQVRQST